MLSVALVGATGSGKSETGNFLIGREAFKTSDLMTSCTDVCQCESRPGGRWEVLDNPGFSHHRKSEEEIRTELANCGFSLAENRKYADRLLDAFLLVARAAPRLSTIVHDLQEFVRLYGKEALKSVVVVIITVSRTTSREWFRDELEGMTEVHKIFKTAGASLVAIPWDNREPWEGMEEELIRAIKSVTPFTSETFFRSREEVHRAAEEGVNKIYKKHARRLAERASQEINCIDRTCDALAESTGEPQRGIASWFFAPISKEIKANQEKEIQKVTEYYEGRIKKIQARHDKVLQEMRSAHGERLETALLEIERLREICKRKASDEGPQESSSGNVLRAIEALFNFGSRVIDLWIDFRSYFKKN